MLYYYYKIKKYDYKKKRLINKRFTYISTHELVIDYMYCTAREGLFKPILLKAIFDNEELIYSYKK